MRHRASPRFWAFYHSLPLEVKFQADRCFENSSSPSHGTLRSISRELAGFLSVRVGLRFRALAVEGPGEDLIWVWIGSHSEYDQLLRSTA